MDAYDALPVIDLQGFTYADRPAFLSELGHAIDTAGAWVLDRKTTSAVTLDLLLEVQSCALTELYAALIASGLELSRSGHRVLAERCNCSLHLPATSFMASILSMRVEIHFLTDAAAPLDYSRLMQLGGAAA